MTHLCVCGLLLVVLILPLATAAYDDNVLRLGLQKYEFKLMNPCDDAWHEVANFFGVTHVPLITYTPDLNIAPCLAEDYEITSNGTSIVFHLVKNATWHDGLPVTAKDVAFSFEYSKKNIIGSEGKWYDTYLDHVDVIDDYTVEVVFKDSVVPASFAYLVATYMLPEHIWSKVEAPKEYEGDDSMVGCGPFIFEKYDQDAQVVYLKANPNYFAGKPAVEALEWHYFRTLDTLLLALKNGEIDSMLDYYNPVPGSYAAGLYGEDIELGIVPDVGVPLHLAFGYRQYPMDLKEFREAVSYAIDYQTVVDAVAAGYGEVPGTGYNPPALPGYRSDLPKLEYDPDKAKEILDEAGFTDLDGDGFREAPNGSKLRIPVTPNYKQYVIRAAELITTQLKQVGLDVYVESLSKEAVQKKRTIDRDYYMLVSWSTPLSNLILYSPACYFVDFPGMAGTCKDPNLIDLVKSASYSKNMDDLMASGSEMQEYMAEELPIIAIIWGDAIYPYRTDRWDGWVPMYGYGSANYWTWLNLKPVSR